MSHMKDPFNKLYGEDTVRRVSLFVKRATHLQDNEQRVHIRPVNQQTAAFSEDILEKTLRFHQLLCGQL